MTLFSKPKINLVDDIDYRERAWRLSRPYIKPTDEVDLNELEKIDLSLAGLRICTFEIYCSAAFRELLFGIRPYHAWTQTSRVNKIEETKFPSYLDFAKMLCIKHLQNSIALLKAGVHQDNARLSLPLAYMSWITVTIDFRTLIGFIKWLKKYSSLYYNEYGTELLKLLKINSVDKFNYGYPIDLNNMPSFYSVGEINNLSNNYIEMTTEITYAQRAQLVRHVGLQVIDTVPLDAHVDPFNLETKTLKNKLIVSIIGPAEVWMNMIRKRTCWIAQFELWEKLTYPFIEKEKSLAKYLPCYGNYKKCKYEADMRGRLNKNDPGIPCPIFLKHMLIGKDCIKQREEKIGNSKILEAYKFFIHKDN